MVELGTPVGSGAYVSSLGDLQSDLDYEPQMEHLFGIGSHCGAHRINMHVAYLNPGAATRAHYHRVSDVAAYVLEGEAQLTDMGPLESPVRAAHS